MARMLRPVRRMPPRALKPVPRRPEQLSPDERDRSNEAVETFVAALGGREALGHAMAIAGTVPEVEAVTQALLDPWYQGFPLRRVCDDVGLTIADLFTAYRKAILTKAHVISEQAIMQTLPAVVADVMARAVPHDVPCRRCLGTGEIKRKPTAKNPYPPPRACLPCGASGKIRVTPDLEHQKLALELGKLISKSPGLNIQQNMLVADQRPSMQAGDLESLQQAVGAILFPSPPREPVEITPTPDPPPTDSA